MAQSLKTLCFSVALFAVSNLPAQAGFWRCELPGGIYTVNLATVSSVSTHEYVVSGAARVTASTWASRSWA